MTAPTSTGHHADDRSAPGRPDGRILTTAKTKIATKCNRDRDFCIFAARNQGVNMPRTTFQAILDRLATIPYRQLHINGGEPTVHKEFGAFSHDARAAVIERVMVLGTNAITIARDLGPPRSSTWGLQDSSTGPLPFLGRSTPISGVTNSATSPSPTAACPTSRKQDEPGPTLRWAR